MPTCHCLRRICKYRILFQKLKRPTLVSFAEWRMRPELNQVVYSRSKKIVYLFRRSIDWSTCLIFVRIRTQFSWHCLTLLPHYFISFISEQVIEKKEIHWETLLRKSLELPASNFLVKIEAITLQDSKNQLINLNTYFLITSQNAIICNVEL